MQCYALAARNRRSVFNGVCLLFLHLAISAPASSETPNIAAAPTVLVFGDSISAGYGIPVEKGWVRLLERKLESQGYAYRVVNASVSGETTSGGLARLPRALNVQRPACVVIELGGNDGLRALSLDDMRSNLHRMIELSQAAGARVLLVGMRLPPNYGISYTNAFHAVFDTLSAEQRVPLVPFLLQDVALHADLMQDDGIHPNVSGQNHLLDTVWPKLAPLLTKAR